MTEHEKLKWICDKIGYESEYEYRNNNNNRNPLNYFIKPEYRPIGTTIIYRIKVDVREIIFTQEFMDKYINKLSYTKPKLFNYEGLIENLDNLVDYLYNLIKPGNVQN